MVALIAGLCWFHHRLKPSTMAPRCVALCNFIYRLCVCVCEVKCWKNDRGRKSERSRLIRQELALLSGSKEALGGARPGVIRHLHLSGQVRHVQQRKKYKSASLMGPTGSVWVCLSAASLDGFKESECVREAVVLKEDQTGLISLTSRKPRNAHIDAVSQESDKTPE